MVVFYNFQKPKFQRFKVGGSKKKKKNYLYLNILFVVGCGKTLREMSSVQYNYDFTCLNLLRFDEDFA